MQRSRTFARAELPGSGSTPSRGRGGAQRCASPSGALGQHLRFMPSVLLAVLMLPGLAWAGDHCESINVTAGTIRNPADIRAFVECARDYVTDNGIAEAARAFRADERWLSDSIYVFVSRQGPSGSEATSFVFPPDPSREGQPWGPLVDEFGSDYYVERARVFDVLGGEDGAAGWMYYSFTNPATGRSEPKASYLIALDWDGTPAIIGAGIYQNDIPATCYPEQVNAMQLDMMPDDMTLAPFVRCAAMVIEGKGFFGVAELMTDRWRSGSVYLFGVDATSGTQLFTGNPARVNGRQMMEGLDDRDPTGRFAGRDAPAVGASFGEAYLYYEGFNPATGAAASKVTFVKRVTAQGTPVLVGAGYYPGATAPVPSAEQSVSDDPAVALGDSGKAAMSAATGGSATDGRAFRSDDVVPLASPARRLLTLENGEGAAALNPRDGGSGGTGLPPMRATQANTIGMEFVEIPAGSFTMGSPRDEDGRFEGEGPQREVTLSQGFGMGKYEVTQGQWEAVMGSNPSHFSNCGARCPVDHVSWDDVQNFIVELNQREAGSGYAYRLPTEAEWEYAARAGTSGARYGALDEIAWYSENSDSLARVGGPRRVGQKQANAWGLHDMLGNVWEWTGDRFGDYRSGAVTDPTGPESGSYRVYRGGSWFTGARNARSAYRNGNAPGRRNISIGFRLVRTNATGMEFVRVTAGSFTMGSPVDEEGRLPDDGPPREVTISRDFWMGKYEVTQGEWVAVMGSNPSQFTDCGPRCPVEQVSWNDVPEFIRRLNYGSAAAGRSARYRLPTEAEWEYAARAGTAGARYGALDEIAWYETNSGDRTHPVGRKRANAWGLHDMLGNVWEWTGDWYSEWPSGGVVTDPTGPETGAYRVTRGGSRYSDARQVRSAHRYVVSPRAQYYDSFGFRLVRTD